MGTYARSIVLLVAALCLALGGFGWAEEPAAEAESEAALVEAAEAEEAACDEMRALAVCEHSKGIAYYYDDRRPEVWVTLGANDGLRVDARVEFVRDEEVVAEGTVVTVRESDCIVYPDEGMPGGAIMLGDYMYVVENGSREAADAAVARERRSHRLLTLLIGGGLAYLISL